MASILSAGGYPVEISLRDDGAGAALSPSAAEILADMKEALARFTAAPLPDLPPPSPEKAKGGFFLPDAFTNSEHVHYALKTTAAAMFCYATYTLLDWPGIHTSLITCYIVALGTTGETVEKLTLRILGCLLGAAMGIAAIVFLMPNFTSIGALMAVVFVATLASGWVAGGSPRARTATTDTPVIDRRLKDRARERQPLAIPSASDARRRSRCRQQDRPPARSLLKP